VEFIDANRDAVVEGARLGVEPIVTVLRDAGVAVAPSSYYAHKKRSPSKRARRDEELVVALTQIWVDNYSVYGVRKLHKAARRAGLATGRDQCRRLMRQAGLRGVTRAKTVKTTRPDPAAGRHPDLVKRDFTATGPNQLWVTDLTYVPT
jgi:putative transposase